MSQVRVYNRNKYPYRETYKGDLITIDPGAYHVMNEKDAEMFLGSYVTAKKTPMGAPDPATFKMLEIVKELNSGANEKLETKFICNADGKEFATKAELDSWEHENHLDKLSDPKVAEEIRKNKGKK